MRASGIRDTSINELSLDVGDDTVGAWVTFHGVVRNHDRGRAVVRIDYESHPSADGILRQIAAEARERPGVTHADAVHRVGLLEIGDVALLAAVGAAHRAVAFETCAWMVDEIKRRLPVWKNQHFRDGTTEWSGLPEA